MTHHQVDQIITTQPYRRTVRLLLLVSLVAGAAWLCSSDLEAIARPAPDGPEVSIGPTKRDFGDVFSGEELEQNFPVRNNGTKPLELSQRSVLGNTQDLDNTRKWSRFQVATADWHSKDQPIPRTVAARLAAPS